jgi:hypothetical protein
MENEVWKDVAIEGFGEIYQVSNLGRVRSKDRLESRVNGKTNTCYQFTRKGQILKQKPNQYGYIQLELNNSKRKKNILVHRLVAMTFIGLPNDEKHQVNHIDGNKTNNQIENLEWVTAKENMRHAHNNKLIVHKKGEFSPRAKKIMQIDKNSGEIIKIWGCVKSIETELNYLQGNISDVANGNGKTAYGFKWKYI